MLGLLDALIRQARTGPDRENLTVFMFRWSWVVRGAVSVKRPVSLPVGTQPATGAFGSLGTLGLLDLAYDAGASRSAIIRVSISFTRASRGAQGKVGREIRASTSPCSAVQTSDASRNGSSWGGATPASKQRRTAATRFSKDRRPGVFAGSAARTWGRSA